MANWPEHLRVRKVRLARPTGQLEKMVEFYRDVIGLPEIERFEGHDGYDGVMIGLPGVDYHLELTTHADGVNGRAPTRDNLLVFYLEDQDTLDAIVERMEEHGQESVSPENPYWTKSGVSYEDPDGWGVVFVNITDYDG